MMYEDDEEPHHALNLAERIRRLANGRSTLDVAQFQFIGISAVRARYGERWPERRDRVQRVARRFISKRIAHDDVLIPGADGFLVVFGACTGVAADRAATRITNELNTFFMGTEHEELRFVSQRSAMSVDDLANVFGRMIADAPQGSQPAPGAPQTAPAAAQPSPAANSPVSAAAYEAQPVWDARREALTTSFLVPASGAPANDPFGFSQTCDPARARFELDEHLLQTSETVMRKLFGSGQRAFIGVSLPVASLNSMTSLTRLFSIMTRFDKQLMRYRIIRVAGIEPGFPRIYLEDIVRTLKVRAPSVALALHWSEPDLASLLRFKPAAIGFTLPEDMAWNTGLRAEAMTRIHAACETARAHDTPVFVEGDITPDQAVQFIANGVSLLSSPQIWPRTPDISGAQKWPVERLASLASPASAA